MRITLLVLLSCAVALPARGAASVVGNSGTARDEDKHPPKHEEARRAVECVQKGKYEEARQLLENLADADFGLPPRVEIREYRKDGSPLAEVVYPPAIGDRRLLLADCLMHLKKVDESMNLVWELLDSGSNDKMLFQILVHGLSNENYAALTRRLKTLREGNPNNAGLLVAEQYLAVAQSIRDGDFGPAVAAVRSGAYDRDSEQGPSAEFKRWVSSQLAASPEKVVPLLIAELQKRETDQPTWIIYCLGLCKDPRAIGPLEKSREWLKNSWVRKEIDAALDRINGRGEKIEKVEPAHARAEKNSGRGNRGDTS